MIGEACPTHHRWTVLRYADGTVKTRDCPECPKYPHPSRAFEIDYWTMPDAALAAAWRDVDAANLATDYDGTVAERLAFIEDAVLQRIGAPDDADPDVPAWQARIRAFGESHTSVITGEENDR